MFHTNLTCVKPNESELLDIHVYVGKQRSTNELKEQHLLLFITLILNFIPVSDLESVSPGGV